MPWRERMRYKKLLLAMALSGVAATAEATASSQFPDLHSMFQNFTPIAPTRAPELNRVIVAINALAPYPTYQYNALLTLVPLADGSLRAATDGPMRQIMTTMGERLLIVDMREESGFSAGDEVDTTTIKETKKTDKSVTQTKTETKNATTTETKVETKTETKKTIVEKDKKTDDVVKKDEIDKKDEKPKEETKTTAVTASVSTKNGSETKKNTDLYEAQRITGVWGQLLGNHTSQNDRDSLPGYRADVLGGVLGRDVFVAPQWTVGVLGAYQHARITQSYLSGSYFDINRYQGTVYSRYRLCEWPLYMLGAVTLAANRYENSRYILVPPFSVIANSTFTGWESDVYLESGYVWKCGNFRAVPKVSLYYSHLNFDSYDESDATFLNLTVKYEDMDELQLGLGGKLDYRNRFEKAYVVPEIHAYYLYDFLNDKQISTAQFFSGGYAFLSQGFTPAPNSYEIGAALSVHSYRNTVIKIQYDFNASRDYHRHAAFIKARYEWC